MSGWPGGRARATDGQLAASLPSVLCWPRLSRLRLDRCLTSRNAADTNTLLSTLPTWFLRAIDLFRFGFVLLLGFLLLPAAAGWFAPLPSLALPTAY